MDISKRRVNSWRACVSVLALAASLGGCNAKQNAADISKDLADKLTDGLDIPGKNVISGEKPQEHAGDPNYPQITKSDFTAGELEGGQKFKADLYTNYQKPDLEGVIIYIPPASKYIQVPAKFSQSDLATLWTRLIGFFRENPDYYNRQFTMLFALYKTGNQAGNYVQWTNVKILPPAGGADGGVKLLSTGGVGEIFKSANYNLELFVSPGQPAGSGGAGGKYKVRLGPGGVRVDPTMGGR
jgi:hypothetical protein